jgi:addiction module RelE/StbE family toxin
MKVRYTQRAIDDLSDIFSYIRQENAPAAVRVIDRIESVVEELGHSPGMGIATDKPGIQRFPVTGTPYLIFYEILEDEVSIAHVRHGARRPWTAPR